MAYSGLVLGLGNPGIKYASTRHNLGFMVIDSLLEQSGYSTHGLHVNRKNSFYDLWEVNVGQEKWLWGKPLTFMNLSGKAAAIICKKYFLKPDNILVVHDELDLSLGVVKFKNGGGVAGHNGLRSMVESLGSKDFHRLRLGIDRPQPGREVAGYVLTGFSPQQKNEMRSMVEKAAQAVGYYMELGLQKATQELHSR